MKRLMFALLVVLACGVYAEQDGLTWKKADDKSIAFREDGGPVLVYNKSGTDIFIPPSHPDHLPSWLTRYYGCFYVGWPSEEARTLLPGQQVTFSYGMLSHHRRLSNEELTQAYTEYAQIRGDSAGAADPPVRIIYKEKSRYQQIYVLKQGSVVSLKFGSPRSTMTQTEVDLDNLRRHMLEYSRLCFAGLLYEQKPRRILVVGLGGGVIPREMHQYYPNAKIDVVEIDPAIPPVARRFFAFPRNSNLQVHVADGREFIEKQAHSDAPPYDLIVLDAYGSKGAPFHLMTKEFLTSVRDILAPDGAVVANLIRTHRFFDSQLKTYLHVFGRYQAYVGDESTNVILVMPGHQVTVLSLESARRRARNLKQARDLKFDFAEVVDHLRRDYLPGRRGTVLTDAMRSRAGSESRSNTSSAPVSVDRE